MKYLNSFIYKPANYLILLAHFSNMLFAQALNAETINSPVNKFTLSGIDGSNSYNETVCPGFSLCFDLFSGSENNSRQLALTYEGTIPGSLFTTNLEKNPTGHFCWTPETKDARINAYEFNVIVADALDPAVKATFHYSITVPVLKIAITTSDVTCYGNSDGAAMATVSGGSGNYMYQWNNRNETSNEVTGLIEGNYTVQVMDDFGCEATATTRIFSPRPLVLETSGKHTSCMLTDGEAEVIALGGTMPYAYSWIQAEGMSDKMVNLSSGVYTAIVTDANGCTAYKQVNISTAVTVDPSSESKSMIASESNLSNVLIFPNPTHDMFTVKNISNSTVTASVVNCLGQDIYHSINIPANLSVSIPMDDQANGIYLVKIQQQANVETIRLVKE
ncbi:hypothetical protein BH11BAC1_BH11BAC1_21630 [soil metagenome]